MCESALHMMRNIFSTSKRSFCESKSKFQMLFIFFYLLLPLPLPFPMLWLFLLHKCITFAIADGIALAHIHSKVANFRWDHDVVRKVHDIIRFLSAVGCSRSFSKTMLSLKKCWALMKHVGFLFVFSQTR